MRRELGCATQLCILGFCVFRVGWVAKHDRGVQGTTLVMLD